ncbi:MAG: acyl carrier protein phosphodiesterase [Saprospiraceae bacterium]
MNYLAHTLLSCHDADILAGNFMADFASRKEVLALEPNIMAGVELHKRIDTFTDSHDEVKAAIHLLHPTQGKYAPVVVDILFDHFLTVHWQKYSEENLKSFTQRVYEMLDDKKDIFPTKLKEKLPYMIADDFLMSCKNEERLKKTFYRVGRRAKFSNNFDKAHLDLENHYQVLGHHFLAFYPELRAHIDGFCDCN